VDDIRFDGLPANWNVFDIGAFSRAERLWDYQLVRIHRPG
jgi:hypothetical protein